MMQSFLRSSSRLSARRFQPASSRFLPYLNRSYAQSYGGDESGHQGTDASNRSEQAEHPGPKAPADEGSSGQKSSKSGGGEERNPEQQQSGSAETGSKKAGGARPALHNPGKAPEDQNEDVRQHNKSFEDRADRSANRINDSGKVEKGFWSGGQ